MDYRNDSSDSRYKCAACFRQFNRKEHLVDHMRISYHSVHEPMCGVCKKHCRSLESLREHVKGTLPKAVCHGVFSAQGCDICLAVTDSPNARYFHQARCQKQNVNHGLLARLANIRYYDDLKIDDGRGPQVVALACKMVGAGSDGSLDVCARVCLIDEHENMIFHAFVKPLIPVTNFRYESTGIRPDYLKDAMPIKQVQKKIQDFLCNGEPMWKIRPKSGKARILVGHCLDHDLDRLQLEYPAITFRDTSKYPPLVKSNKLSNSLKYLAQAYLGYETGVTDHPYEDCVASMRLYMRMRSQGHKREDHPLASDPQNRNTFASWRQAELEKMTSEELLSVSRSDYYCWRGRFSQGFEESGEQVPFSGCYLADVPQEHREILISQGCIVREIDPVYPPENQTEFAMAYYVINYSKLRIWEFVEYCKMIYLDGDIQVFENIDHLFELQDGYLYAVMDCFCEKTWSHTPHVQNRLLPTMSREGPVASRVRTRMFVYEPDVQEVAASPVRC
ncbi:hypothetical protein ACFE04_005027 [Oxalis oulophora]